MWKLYRDTANLCSLLGLSAGFLSLALAAKGDLPASVVAMLTGVLADVFDGPIARSAISRTEEAAAFGRELDSLADMSHSVLAPSVLVIISANWSFGGIVSGLLLAAAGTTRLGFFGLKYDRLGTHVTGLPVTYLPLTLALLKLSVGTVHSSALLFYSLAMVYLQTSAFLFPKFSGWKFYVEAGVTIVLWLASIVALVRL